MWNIRTRVHTQAKRLIGQLPLSCKERIKKLLHRDIASRSRAYREAFALRLELLQSLPVPDSAQGPSFSFLTTVYEKTNCQFLQLLAQDVLNQTYQNFEWIILCHGGTSDATEQELIRLAGQPRVRVFYLEKNRGITGGLHYCLKKAECEYVIPLDADDRIEICTLAMIARVILDTNNPDYCYTDEDLLSGSIIHNPCYRPPCDPVLLQAASYVFHLTAFRRDVGLSLKIYTDDVVAACHDWDTLSRFYVARKRIVHVPEVVYHWRQHEDSISNAGTIRDINRLTLPRVMRRFVEARGLGDAVVIEEFPIFRGITEYHYRWVGKTGFEITRVPLLDQKNREWSTVPEMRAQVEKCPPGSLVFVHDERLEFVKDSCVSELNVWFSLVPQLAFFAGRVLTSNGTVGVGGLMFSRDGGRIVLTSPEQGHPGEAGGPYAMFLKPHCVDAVFPGFFAARREQLLRALMDIPDETKWKDVGAWIGAWAMENGYLTGWSPLFQASASDGYCEMPPVCLPSCDALIALHDANSCSSQWLHPMQEHD